MSKQKKEWFIEGNVPSLKNSKIKTSRGIFPSKTVMKYLQKLGIKKYSSSKKEVEGYKTRTNSFFDHIWDFPKDIEYPIQLGFHFVRDSQRDFDFNNATQIILDLLTAHKFIEDDSMKYIIPFAYKKNGNWYSIDKENPGVFITIK